MSVDTAPKVLLTSVIEEVDDRRSGWSNQRSAAAVEVTSVVAGDVEGIDSPR